MKRSFSRTDGENTITSHFQHLDKQKKQQIRYFRGQTYKQLTKGRLIRAASHVKKRIWNIEMAGLWERCDKYAITHRERGSAPGSLSILHLYDRSRCPLPQAGYPFLRHHVEQACWLFTLLRITHKELLWHTMIKTSACETKESGNNRHMEGREGIFDSSTGWVEGIFGLLPNTTVFWQCHSSWERGDLDRGKVRERWGEDDERTWRVGRRWRVVIIFHFLSSSG